MQVMGGVPTISVEKTDGCQMYLSQHSLHTHLITAQSSEMNVLIPAGEAMVHTLVAGEGGLKRDCSITYGIDPDLEPNFCR